MTAAHLQQHLWKPWEYRLSLIFIHALNGSLRKCSRSWFRCRYGTFALAVVLMNGSFDDYWIHEWYDFVQFLLKAIKHLKSYLRPSSSKAWALRSNRQTTIRHQATCCPRIACFTISRKEDYVIITRKIFSVLSSVFHASSSHSRSADGRTICPCCGIGSTGDIMPTARLSWFCPKGAQERSLGTVFTQGLGMVRMGFSGWDG